MNKQELIDFIRSNAKPRHEALSIEEANQWMSDNKDEAPFVLIIPENLIY